MYFKSFTDPDPIIHYAFTLGLWECIGILIGYIIAYRYMAYIFLNMSRTKQ